MDCLDNSSDLLNKLSNSDVRVISFEDRNINKFKNRLVINAIYEGNSDLDNRFGYKNFILRDDFFNINNFFLDKNDYVLISFGGTDPQNYTKRVYEAIRKVYDGQIKIIFGMGYDNELSVDNKTTVYKNITNMAYHMARAKFAFTSAGRTPIECASVFLPAVVLNQNQRELEHKFPSYERGFIRHNKVKISDLELENLVNYINKPKEILDLKSKMKLIDFKKYTTQTINRIKNHLE